MALAPAILFLAHRLYGANQRDTSLTLAAIEAILLVGWLLIGRTGRDSVSNAGVLWVPAAALSTVFVVVLWSMTPWVIGGPLPVWAWSGAVGAATLDRSATALELVKLAGVACIGLVGFIQGARVRQARATLWLVLGLGALYAFGSLVGFLSGAEVVGQAHRFGAGFLSPNSAGTLFAVLVVVSVAGVVQTSRPRSAATDGKTAQFSRMAFAITLLLLFSGCLLLTASRTAIVLAGLAVVVMVIWEILSGGLKARSGAMMLSAWGGNLLLLAAGAGAVFLSRVDAVSTDLVRREAILRAHWEMFLISPLTGWGLGAFDALNQQILTLQSFDALWDLRAAHNVFVQWLEEAGLLGAAPMFGAVAAVIILTALAINRAGRDQTWVRGLLMADAIFILHGLTDFALQVPSLAAFWSFLLGLQLGMTRRAVVSSRRSPA